jgi:hypothetical protein
MRPFSPSSFVNASFYFVFYRVLFSFLFIMITNNQNMFMNGMKEDGEGEGFPLSVYDYGVGIGEAQGFGNGDGGHGSKVGPNEVIIDKELDEINLEIFETKIICIIGIVHSLA